MRTLAGNVCRVRAGSAPTVRRARWGLVYLRPRTDISTDGEHEHHGAHRRARPHHRLRDRRQQCRLPPHPTRLDGRRPARQGPAAEPRRLHGARLELHLPRRPLEGDDAAHASTARASTRRWASSPSAAGSRSRAPRSAWRSSADGWPRRRRGASSRYLSSHRQRSRSSSRTSTSPSCSEASTRRASVSSTRCAQGRSCASAVSRRAG